VPTTRPRAIRKTLSLRIERREKDREGAEENLFVGALTTLRCDGSPHSTVVWVEDEYSWANPDKRRLKVVQPAHFDSSGFDE
jgi:hypothetical protein